MTKKKPPSKKATKQTKKATNKKPTKKATKKATKPPKKTTRPKATKKPTKKNPVEQSQEMFLFNLRGATPSAEQIEKASNELWDLLQFYEPIRTAPNIAFYPWLARRFDQPNLIMFALADLLDAKVIKVYTDPDRLRTMSRQDRDLCPSIDGQPLVWIKFTPKSDGGPFFD